VDKDIIAACISKNKQLHYFIPLSSMH